MPGHVDARLEPHAEEYETVRQLHDVPPHEVYEVRVDGRRAVCKLAADPEADPATEARVLRHVREHTSVPVPRVLAAGEDYFVAEWEDGVPDDTEMNEPRARAMGAGLATLHEETGFEAPGFFQADGPLVDAHDRWSDVLIGLLADRREYLDPLGYADVAEAAIEFVAGHREAFDGVDPVLVHGNYLPDHVGVAGGEVVSVIDFEHALAGAAGLDLVRATVPLPSGEGDAIRDAFLAGYESVRPLPTGFLRRSEAHEAVNAVSYLRALHLQDQHDPAETERRAERLREHVFEMLDDLETRLG